MHGLQDVRVGQRYQVACGAQHHTDDHAGQQQAQCVQYAIGQHQGQQYAPDGAGKGRARQADAHQPLRGKRRHAKQRQRQCQAKSCARCAA